ncbi:MAG: polyprenyl diphosphate synthase [Gammaproteobacteria bacterium]
MTKADLPKHVSIIMDGNNRWAKGKGLPGVSGHEQGVKRARLIIELAVEKKIKTLTLFTFSSENWNRSKEEVDLLMKLLSKALKDEVPSLVENKVSLKFIGDLSKFTNELQDEMKESELLTHQEDQDKQLDLLIAASYGGRWEILETVNKLRSLELDKHEKIDEELFSSYTSLSTFPDPDLCIRTGGEKRISNFLLWHLAYTELFFTDILWPDFDEKELDKALEDFSIRNRNFGDKSNFQGNHG